jgi:hypothetical protein
MLGLEYHLWNMIEGGTRMYGMAEVPKSEVDILRTLAHAIGGWIFWIDECPEFMPMSEWRELFANWKSQREGK